MTGAHARYAQWNEALLRHAVPALWLEVLRGLTFGGERFGARATFAELGVNAPPLLLSSLPDLSKVQREWQPCAQQLYSLLSNEALLPHPSPDMLEWYRPRL